LSLGDLAITNTLGNTDTSGIASWIYRLDGPFDPLRHARAVALTGLLAAIVGALFLLARPRPRGTR
jgi:ABC-type Fe3+ transport system permease subunit